MQNVTTLDNPKRRHNPNSPELRALRKRAAQMLADGHKLELICSRLGISRVTLWRWRCKADFKRLVRAIGNEQHAEVTYFKQATKRDLVERMYHLAQSENEATAFRATAFLLKHE